MTTRTYAHPTSLGDVILLASLGDDGQHASDSLRYDPASTISFTTERAGTGITEGLTVGFTLPE